MSVAEIPSAAPLAERLAAREESALAELYERYGRSAYGLALRIVGEPALAEDVVQRAFLAAWRSVGSRGEERRGEAGWLLAIVHREAVAVARTRPHRLRGGRAGAVSPALAAVPPEEREALELAYFAAMTESEIAAALGLERDEVRARIVRAMRALQAASR